MGVRSRASARAAEDAAATRQEVAAAMTSDTAYTVHTERFHGPLDLLLELIRKAELDITEIALAEIAGQFLEHVAQLRDVDVDDAGEFLVVAASLVEIKSRAVDHSLDPNAGPRARSDDDDDESNPAAELLSQLLAYKAFRDAAEGLERRREAWLERYPAAKAHTDKAAIREAADEGYELDELDPMDLVRAFQRIADAVEFTRLGQHQVEDDDTPIELHAADLVDQLGRDGRTPRDDRVPRWGPAERGPALPLTSIFASRTRPQCIGLFLAMLELMKQQAIRVYHASPAEHAAAGPNGAIDPSEVLVELVPGAAGASTLAEPSADGESADADGASAGDADQAEPTRAD
jgi:segregation and condensation protein A